MGPRIFTALPLTCLTVIFLFSLRGSTVTCEIFASAVGTLNRASDHRILRLSNDFCPYFTTPFSCPPLPERERLAEQQRKRKIISILLTIASIVLSLIALIMTTHISLIFLLIGTLVGLGTISVVIILKM